MDFYAMVEQALILLRSRGRVPYRALKLQLQVDDDAIEALKKALKDKKLTEDVERRAQDDVQKLTDRHIAEADGVLGAKEKELMEI